MKPQELGALTLDVGPAGGGKTASALAEYAAVLRASASSPSGSKLLNCRRALWLSTTRAAAHDIREALVDLAGPTLEPGVTTFSTLAGDIVREGGLEVVAITSLQRRRLIGRLIAEAAASRQLAHYAPVAGSTGLVSIVDQQLADLQKRGLAVDQMRADADRLGDPQSRDIALLFDQYLGALAPRDASAPRLADAETMLSTAVGVLETRTEAAAGLELVVVDGFASFTPVERRLLDLVSKCARRAIVTLPGEASDAQETAPRGDLFAQPLEAIAQFAKTSRVKISRQPSPSRKDWPAIRHLERNLFRAYRTLEPPKRDVVESIGRLHIVAASGVQAEIVEIARRVKRLLADGEKPTEIVVAFRSTRDVTDRVRHTFDDFGIPFRLDNERRLAATPLVRSLQNVLRLASEDWPYRTLLQVVSDRSLHIFDGEEGCESSRIRQAIEMCVRYAQLPSGRRTLIGQLAAWADDADRVSEPKPEDAILARDGLGKLSGLLDLVPKRATIERWIGALGSLAAGVGLLRPATAEAEANWAILARGLRGAERIDALTSHANQEITLAEFVDTLSETAAHAPAAQMGDGSGCVRVLSAESARMTRPRHLIVGGLSEQSFPAPHRGAVALAGAANAADLARSAEMLLFYQLVTRPTQTLTLSYPALDERAQTLPASPFLIELERAFGDASVPRTDQPLNYGQQAVDDDPPLSRSELRRSAVGRALDRRRELLASMTKADGAAILDGIEAVADRGRRDEFGAFEGLLTSEAAAARLSESFGPQFLWSPSRLETYAACPFLFFGQHLLRLHPTPELVLASDMRRRGSVLHEVLAQLYAGLRGQSLDPETANAILMDQFQAALANVAEARPGRGVDAAIREIERRQIAAWAEEFAKQDADYRAAWQSLDQPLAPTYFEARFGPGSKRSESKSDAELSTDKPFALNTNVSGAAERVQFTGQIDRIDVGRVGDRTVFNVIDYKTSARAAVRDAEIHAGRQIQLPLYAMAIEQLLLAEQNAAPLSAGYWSVQGRGFALGARTGGPLPINEIRDGALRPAPSWESTRDKLIARIGEIIGDIRRGRFPVFNDDANCTDNCELRTICRIAQVRGLEKQWPPNEATLGTTRSEAKGRGNADELSQEDAE